jgi:ankyrin repeat protein
LLRRGALSTLRDDRGHTALHLASSFRSETLLELLLGAGADVNFADINGNTPLRLAPRLCAVRPDAARACVATLLAAHPVVEAQDSAGRTALACVVERRQGGSSSSKVTSDLLAAGASAVLAVGPAVENGATEVVAKALADGADPNRRTASGATMLHVAAAGGFADCVEVLLESGADMDAFDADGRTPLQVAVQSTSREIVCVLVKAGAEVSKGSLGGTPALHTAVTREQ